MNLIKIRQDLHSIPEPGFKEIKTQKYILDILEQYDGIKIHTFSHTGILVEYSCGEGDYVMYRADMDALSIDEKTAASYASTHPGFMHACGHDVHMTVLLGFIHKVITEKVPKNILFLFPPAEEGLGGAQKIITSKVFQSFKIKSAYALHVTGDYDVGTVASKAGIIFGIPLEFKVEFKGRSAHAAYPHKGVDALLPGMTFYQEMLKLISREFSPIDAVIFHVGTFESGQAMNIVPDSAKLAGTIRVFTKENRAKIQIMFEQTAAAVARLYGVSYDFDFPGTFDPVINDAKLYQQFQGIASDEIKVGECPALMVGEDFGFFSGIIPSLLVWLGGGVTGIDLHNCAFLPDDACLDVGVNLFWKLLNN